MTNAIKILYSQFIRILKAIIDWQDNPKNISGYILQQTLLFSIILTAVATYTNFQLRYRDELSLTTAIAAIIFSIAYYQLRWRHKNRFALYVFISLMLILLNVLWFFNGGSFGPTLLVFQVFFGLFLFTISNSFTKPMVIVYAINIAILFYIEYRYPELIVGYNNINQRFTDIVIATFLFFFGGLPLLTYGKRRFQREKEKAQKSERIKTAFIANMSHEIRTPMNAIIGFTELLEDNLSSEKEKRQFLNIIRENGDLLLHLINNIMDISKLDAKLVEVNYTNVRIETFIEKIYNTYRPIIDPKIKLTAKISPQSGNLVIRSDMMLLYQVFSNMLNNAIKVTKKGEIKFGIELKDRVRFYVSDTGPGIPPGKQEVIFERFSQLNPSIPINQEGVGLGLSICKSIMDLLGGRIYLHSDSKSGTTFYFDLPLDVIVIQNIRWWDKNLTGI